MEAKTEYKVGETIWNENIEHGKVTIYRNVDGTTLCDKIKNIVFNTVIDVCKTS